MDEGCEVIAESCSVLWDVIETDQENEQWKDDATWILTSSFVILTMQSGFGLLEIGCSSAGNEVNTMLKNVADIVFGALAFYMAGYGIAFGTPASPFMGMGSFFPDGSEDTTSVESGVLYSRYLFQLSFAATSATIVSGCIAMRMRFEVYCLFAFYAVLVYSFVAHWVWADNGWLMERGFYDFAGGAAVHMHGAVNGLIAILFVGPRHGRFQNGQQFEGRRKVKTCDPKRFDESSPTSMLVGLFMLWWGWIGFNCGSTFGITNDKWLVAARAGVNTINSASAGGIVAMIYSKWRSKNHRYIQPPDVVNGILGALVASSPTCAAVHTYDALAVGAVGSLLACWTNDTVVREWLQLDDPVGALGVHGMAGIWGVLSVALFADKELPGVGLATSGAFRGGGFELLGHQVIGLIVISLWSVATMTPFFYIVGILISWDVFDPRKGLRYDMSTGYQLDLGVHGCQEDNTDDILAKVEVIINDHLSRTVSALDDDEDSGDEAGYDHKHRKKKSKKKKSKKRRREESPY